MTDIQYRVACSILKVSKYIMCSCSSRAGLTIRGPHTNVRRGTFSSTRSQDFLICGGALFPPKVDDLFLVVVTFKRTLNVQTSKQRGKSLAADRRGPPCDWRHGTIGTMDNPALSDLTKFYTAAHKFLNF